MWCNGCGQFFETDLITDWLGAYCSDRCQMIYHKRKKLKEPKEVVCNECGNVFKSPRTNAKHCSKGCYAIANARAAKERDKRLVREAPSIKEIVCAWCDDVLVIERNPETLRFPFGKFHDDCRLQARRANNRKKTVKRQGAKTQETILHEVIAERDGFICHLCNEPVDMAIPRTSRLGATLDHVIPISKGGLDTEDNVKLAHWICNVRKSDKLGAVDA